MEIMNLFLFYKQKWTDNKNSIKNVAISSCQLCIEYSFFIYVTNWQIKNKYERFCCL